jgi:putative ABC transport system substrate-binding protein
MKRLAVGLVVALISGLLGAPLTADGQQAGRVHRIGMLLINPTAFRPESNPWDAALAQGLRERGYVLGQNLLVEVRSAQGKLDRLPAVAAELVGLGPDVIVVGVCGVGFDVVRQATRTIPIVVQACNDDLVASGAVASLARPGGNVTGISKLTPELTAKRLELLRDLVPRASRVAVLWEPGYSDFAADWRALRSAAQARGVTLLPVEARGGDDLPGAFARMASERAEAVIMFSGWLAYLHAGRVAELAATHRLPAIYAFREVPDAGGLISYGPNLLDLVRRSAGYVDRILKGAKPADLPVEQPTKFELVVNLKTAKALGLTVPQSVLLRADEVIQ